MINLSFGIIILILGMLDLYNTITKQKERDFFSNCRNYGTSIFLLILGFAFVFDILVF